MPRFIPLQKAVQKLTDNGMSREQAVDHICALIESEKMDFRLVDSKEKERRFPGEMKRMIDAEGATADYKQRFALGVIDLPSFIVYQLVHRRPEDWQMEVEDYVRQRLRPLPRSMETEAKAFLQRLRDQGLRKVQALAKLRSQFARWHISDGRIRSLNVAFKAGRPPNRPA